MFLSGMVGTTQIGTEKKFKITVASTGLSLATLPPTSAIAGAFVKFSCNEGNTMPGISAPTCLVPYTGSGESQPFSDRAATRVTWYYFVMPAEDVTISERRWRHDSYWQS